MMCRGCNDLLDHLVGANEQRPLNAPPRGRPSRSQDRSLYSRRARELIALGHETRLMPPSYVKAYVKRNKHDVADAEAICEAVRRPSMRFVPLKTAEQQSALMMHRARDLLIRQRTMLVNALRGHLAEFGLVEAQGLHKVAGLTAIVKDDTDERVPAMARQVLKVIAGQIDEIQGRIAALEAEILTWHKSN